MKKFSYSKMNPLKFNGESFYEKYKDADFLNDVINIQNVLSKQGELEHFMNNLKPGESCLVEGMFIKMGSPLTITKSGRTDEQDVDIEAFTPRRLSGLVAAYVFDNISEFQDIYASEAEELGIRWSFDDRDQQCAYLSAVSGAEYYVKHFIWGPLICALKKHQLNLINDEMLLDIMNVRHFVGKRMSLYFMKLRGKSLTKLAETLISLGDTFDVEEAIKTLPEHIRCFIDNPE